ncbi:unnamed protein product [Allacma fusca]|uniref:Uncharacterized protein n=1 Tax=Allacma fusca TaxID=39272 RepID=A0A8J2P7D8_9HEXA|nr:unnamed protein product [Allacma fusca]
MVSQFSKIALIAITISALVEGRALTFKDNSDSSSLELGWEPSLSEEMVDEAPIQLVAPSATLPLISWEDEPAIFGSVEDDSDESDYLNWLTASKLGVDVKLDAGIESGHVTSDQKSPGKILDEKYGNFLTSRNLMEKQEPFYMTWSKEVERLIFHGNEQDPRNVILSVGYPNEPKHIFVLSRAILKLSSPRLGQMLENDSPNCDGAYEISDVTPDQFNCMALHMHLQGDLDIAYFALKRYQELKEVEDLVAVAVKYELYELVEKINCELVVLLLEEYEIRNQSTCCQNFDILKIMLSNDRILAAAARKFVFRGRFLNVEVEGKSSEHICGHLRKSCVDLMNKSKLCISSSHHNQTDELVVAIPTEVNKQSMDEKTVPAILPLANTQDILDNESEHIELNRSKAESSNVIDELRSPNQTTNKIAIPEAPDQENINRCEQSQEILLSTVTIIAIIVAVTAIFIAQMHRRTMIQVQSHVRGNPVDGNPKMLILNDMAEVGRQLQALTKLTLEHDKFMKLWEEKYTHFEVKNNEDIKTIKDDLTEIKQDLSAKILKIVSPKRQPQNDFGADSQTNKEDNWKHFLQESQKQGSDLLKSGRAGQRACAVLIRNSASVKLWGPVTYHLHYNHQELQRLPNSIAPGATKIFGFSYSTDMLFEVMNSFEILPAEANGGFAYHVGDATFVAKYTQQLSGGNSFAIGFLDRNTALKKQSLIRDWSRNSENVNVFSQAFEGQEATVAFRNLHVRASITTGSRAVLTICISDNDT